jgi:hypothetical protein
MIVRVVICGVGCCFAHFVFHIIIISQKKGSREDIKRWKTKGTLIINNNFNVSMEIFFYFDI